MVNLQSAKTITREEWLDKAMKLLDKEFFSGKGYTLPPPDKLKVAPGFPKGKKAIGQCWCPSHTADNVTHMFICPTLDDEIEVLGTLLHEMIHALIGVKEKHGPRFKKFATEFGLAGKMRATTVAEGSDLQRSLLTIAGKLGDYPHSAIKFKKGGKDGDGDGPEKERKWITFISPSEPKYNVGIHLTKVIEFGRPKDFQGDKMVAKKPEIEELLKEEHGI